MKVEVEEVSPCLKRLSIEVPVEEVQGRVETAYRELGRKAKVAGFRPGKVPRKILERYFHREVERDVVEKIIPETLQKAVEEQALPVLGQPRVNPVQMSVEKPIQYTVEVDVLPRVEVKGYEGLSFTRKKTLIGEAQVDLAVSKLQDQMAEFSEVPEAQVAEGDYVVVDFDGTIDGQPMEKGKGENFPLVVGSGSLLPEFERKLVGTRKGDASEVTVTYPPDYHNAELAGKTGVFTVSVKELKKKSLPEVNDEFAKSVDGECDSVAQLREKVKDSLQQEADRQAQAELQEAVVDRLIEMNPLEVPQVLVEEEAHALAEEFERSLKARGLQMPAPAEGHREWVERFREQAARRVKGELILEHVAAEEKVTLAEEEVEKEIEQLGARSRQGAEAVRNTLARNRGMERLRESLKRRKTWDVLLGKLQIQDVTEEPTQATENNP